MTDPNTPDQQHPLLANDDRTNLRRRWIEIEEGFVDDPADAIHRADDLIDNVIDRLRDAFGDRRAALRSRWETLDDATTEQMRIALHSYEQLFMELAELPAPSGWQSRDRGGRPTAHGRPTFPPTEDSTQSDSDMGARS